MIGYANTNESKKGSQRQLDSIRIIMTNVNEHSARE
ncbi:hypothetical protein PUN28_005008 [Cardiocondyla obscurior]|uniref:Ribosomal protein S15 n=1 Tax=Cardiocondyla obscurior TaxID=286306 RepID=A0AAW2GFI4_9HYME